MKFQAFYCPCGYQLVTAEDEPKCPDCGEMMVIMKTDSQDYKEFNKELKTFFGGK
jgi:transcription initiation factor IIE alpha subunit